MPLGALGRGGGRGMYEIVRERGMRRELGIKLATRDNFVASSPNDITLMLRNIESSVVPEKHPAQKLRLADVLTALSKQAITSAADIEEDSYENRVGSLRAAEPEDDVVSLYQALDQVRELWRYAVGFDESHGVGIRTEPRLVVSIDPSAHRPAPTPWARSVGGTPRPCYLAHHGSFVAKIVFDAILGTHSLPAMASRWHAGLFLGNREPVTNLVVENVLESVREHSKKSALYGTLPEPLKGIDLTTTDCAILFLHGLCSTDVKTFDGFIHLFKGTEHLPVDAELNAYKWSWQSNRIERNATGPAESQSKPTKLIKNRRPQFKLLGWQHNSLLSVDDNAEQLEVDLKMALRGSTTRFVLVCHSRGGLVARALLERIDKSKSGVWPRRKPLIGKESIAGIITFGTPHKGAKLACYPGHLLVPIASYGALLNSGWNIIQILAYFALKKGQLPGISDLQPADRNSRNLLYRLEKNEAPFKYEYSRCDVGGQLMSIYGGTTNPRVPGAATLRAGTDVVTDSCINIFRHVLSLLKLEPLATITDLVVGFLKRVGSWRGIARLFDPWSRRFFLRLYDEAQRKMSTTLDSKDHDFVVSQKSTCWDGRPEWVKDTEVACDHFSYFELSEDTSRPANERFDPLLRAQHFALRRLYDS